MKATTKPLLTLNEQHDFITLRTPNGNYTSNRYGYKCSGRLCYYPNAIKNINNFINNEIKKPGATYGQIMRMLTNEKTLTTLWPEWNEKIEKFKINDRVNLSEKGYGLGTVYAVKGKNAHVLFDNKRRVSVPMSLLERIK